MRTRTQLAIIAGLLVWTGAASAQWISIRPVAEHPMPARTDSNSPAFWRNGQLYVINSTGLPGTPVISHGDDQFSQSNGQEVQLDSRDHFPMWIESVWQDGDGTLYAWYHHEPSGVCPGGKLTAPKIGALVSYDGGYSFTDLGIVLESGDPADCSAKNGFFAGGHGDFSVIPDRTQGFFYFLFDNYGGDVSSQGVAIARMAFEDRANPVGLVWKRFEQDWNEPGLGGRMTPIFPVNTAWQQADTDAFWGPSVHWNTYLESYVVLLSHACCKPNWPQEGIYMAFNSDLSNPAGWNHPVKIMGKVNYDAGFYPQVIGIAPGETDTLSGRTARLYVHGKSLWEVIFQVFVEPEEPQEPSDPAVPMDPEARKATPKKR